MRGALPTRTALPRQQARCGHTPPHLNPPPHPLPPSAAQLFEAAQRLARQPDAALVALLEFHTQIGEYNMFCRAAGLRGSSSSLFFWWEYGACLQDWAASPAVRGGCLSAARGLLPLRSGLGHDRQTPVSCRF